nr:hypothetical protein [Tanacetum cinerariifolium]
MGSPPSRVILFGDIPTVIPSTSIIAPETFAIAPVISSTTPVVETTVDPYVTTVTRWRSRVTTRSSSPSDFSIARVTAPPDHHRRTLMLLPLLVGGAGVMIARKRVGTFPARRLAWRHVSPRSSDHHPSSSSSPTYSFLVHSSSLDAPSQAHVGSSTRVVSPRLGYPPVRAPRHSEAFLHWCIAPLSTFYPPTTSESSLGDSSKRPLHSSSHSAGPSRKRCRSPTDFIPSSTPVTGSLAPTHADLLPPCKRFKDSYSPETSMEEDSKIDTTKTKDGRELYIVNEDDVRDHIEVDLRDDREEFKASAGDTIMLGIDPRSVLMVDEEIVEPVGVDSSSSSGTRDGTFKSVKDIPVGLDGAIRDIYHHMYEIHDDRDDLRRKLRRFESFTERLENLNGNHNDGNGNKNGNGNGQGGNRNEDGRGDRPVARECTYQDFMKCQPLNFKGTEGVNTRGQNVARAYTAGNNEKMEYVGTLPYCNRSVMAVTTQRTPGLNQRVVTCFESGAQGNFQKDYPKAKNQNLGNKARVPDARGKAYVLGGGHANSGSNTVTGTFLLNHHHAYMLFDSGANRSFVSNTFSTLLDITPSVLDVSYTVELANERTSETCTMLRAYTLRLLGHPFNIDLMPIDWVVSTSSSAWIG